MSLSRAAVVLQRPKQRIHTGNVVRGSACETHAGSVTDQVVVLRVERAVQIGRVPVSRVVGDERILKVDGAAVLIIDATTTAAGASPVSADRAVGQSDRATSVINAAAKAVSEVAAHPAVV